MDKFNKYAFIACAAMCIIIIAFYYIGFALSLGGLGGGADDAVNNAATASGGGQGHPSWYDLSQNGEYVGFGMIGVLGGLAVGYLYPAVFENPACTLDKTETEKIETGRAN